MGVELTSWKVGKFPQGINRWISGDAGGKASKGDIVVVEAVAVESGEFIFLRHGEAVRGAVLHTVATEDADTEINGIVPKLLLLGGLVHDPVDNRQVDRTDPDTHLTGDAFVEFVVDPASVALGWDQLLVGVLHRDGAALHVVEGDSETLGEVAGSVHGIAGVVADLF